MKNLLLMLGLIISLTCSSQNNTTESKFYMPNIGVVSYGYADYLLNPSTPDSTIESKFTQIQMGGLIYAEVEYIMVLKEELLSKARISIIFDIIKEEAYVKVNDKERKTYSISSNVRQKIGYDKSYVRQSEDKTYIQLTVRNDDLEVFNTFKILLPELRDIEMSRRLYR